MIQSKTMAAIELNNQGIRRIVVTGETAPELAATYRLLSRAAAALAELNKSIKCSVTEHV
jgi:hypothetical protein